MLLVVTHSIPAVYAEILDSSGFSWKVASSLDGVANLEPSGGWTGVVILGADTGGTVAALHDIHHGDRSYGPVLIALEEDDLQTLYKSTDAFDDFIVLPMRASEFAIRLRRLFGAQSTSPSNDIVTYDALTLNVATYQAAVAGRALDMTYMEYELLKHFVTNPGRVLTRAELLKNVWGYDYYGGARTVDVHVRRLRAKLGDEHAQLINTVRSVGYIFGRRRQ